MHGLYLDTARFGRMEPATQLADRDFARLLGDEGASPRIESLLVSGLGSLPGKLRRRYAGLSRWQGLSGLKEALRGVVHADPSSEVLLAQRSTLLMKLAARALFRRSRRVLHTDLEWPGYLSLLDTERGRARGEMIPLPVRDLVFRDGISTEELVRVLANHFRENECDGLFLSAVSHEGVRLPVAEIMEILSLRQRPRFVVVDGSQAIGHASNSLPLCDLFLGGTHKWLGSGHPLGVGFIPRPSARGFVMATVEEMIGSGDLDDPLLKFCRHLEAGFPECPAETVGLTPLFTCMEAASRRLDAMATDGGTVESRIANGDALSAVAAETNWIPVRPDGPLRSGILLMEARGTAARSRPPSLVREAFRGRGVTLSAYLGGTVRLSMPANDWEPADFERLTATLRRLS